MSTKIICTSSLCLYHNRNHCTLTEIKIGYPIPKCTSFRLSEERLGALTAAEAADTKQGRNVPSGNRDCTPASPNQEYN